MRLIYILYFFLSFFRLERFAWPSLSFELQFLFPRSLGLRFAAALRLVRSVFLWHPLRVGDPALEAVDYARFNWRPNCPQLKLDGSEERWRVKRKTVIIVWRLNSSEEKSYLILLRFIYYFVILNGKESWFLGALGLSKAQHCLDHSTSVSPFAPAISRSRPAIMLFLSDN